MMKLDTAIQRCTDRCNLIGENVDIIKYMHQYKAISELPEKEFDEVYDCIARALGFMQEWDWWMEDCRREEEWRNRNR